MRILVVLVASLLFAGCPSPPPPISARPTPAATPNPTQLPDASPEVSPASPIDAPESAEASPSVSPESVDTSPSITIDSADATPNAPEELSTTPNATDEASTTPMPTDGTPISYEGPWTVADAQGQAYDMVIFPNGQAVTTWTKGTEGARGERGYWRQDERGVTVVYSDGSTDVIEHGKNGFQHRRYSAGSPLDSQPLAQGEARRCEGNHTALVGVWRLNKEPDGSHLYIALQSGGRAVSTINGGTEGKWKVNENGALCEWPDGWVDQIERGNAGWQKRSWIGSESSTPADLSLATRVGEMRFSVDP